MEQCVFTRKRMNKYRFFSFDCQQGLTELIKRKESRLGYGAWSRTLLWANWMNEEYRLFFSHN